MPHEVIWSHDYNGYLRQLRAFLKNAPRLVRSNDHDDINNLGISYILSGSGARPAGDILHVAPEVSCPQTVHRATCVVAGGNASYQTTINATVTFNVGANTITATDSTNWSTAGVVAGSLVRIGAATTAGNNNVFRVLSITTTSTTNDTITLNALDVLAASDAGESVTVTPITGGAIFDVREDYPGTNTHIGWLASSIEFMSKDSTLWMYMRNGSAWAVGDYAEFELEHGAFTFYEDRAVTRVVSFNDNNPSADTITRKDYNGNFIFDGFVAGGLVEVVGGTNAGTHLISTVTAKTITVDAGVSLTDEVDVEVVLIPRFQQVVTFNAASKTMVRASGSWIDDGFLDGGYAEIANAFDAGNNGYLKISTVTALTITFDAGETIADEVSDTITITPRNTNLRAWSDYRYRYSYTSAATGDATTELKDGALPPIPNSNGNYTSEWVGIAPGNDPINNPQTIYCGWQTQFSSTVAQNVEIRAFDVVSDSDFAALGNTSPPVYIYLTLSPSMETFLTGDGEFVGSLVTVGSSIAEWSYSGFVDLHGTQAQHPRPIFVGGTGYSSTKNRSTTGNTVQAFMKGVSRSVDSTATSSPAASTGWFRWLDGQWRAVFNAQLSSTESTALNMTYLVASMFTWPWSTNYLGNDSAVATAMSTLADGLFTPFSSGSDTTNQSAFVRFQRKMVPTPITITPNPNREYPLFPITLIMQNPTVNIVADLRSIFFTSHDGQASKNRILDHGKVGIVGQNHEKTGTENFAVLQLN